MLITLWSTKGGSGCSVVAASLARQLAGSLDPAGPVVLADLGGDAADVLGCPPVTGSGLLDVIHQQTHHPAEALSRLAFEVTDGLFLVGPGSVPPSPAPWSDAAEELDRDAVVVVDAGNLSASRCADQRDLGRWLAATADRSLLVTRACFLSLRRGRDVPISPSGVVLVAEHGRSLGRADVEAALGAPVVATVAVDPAIARAVDAGLLAARLPRGLGRSLRAVA